ncbi:mitochondrial tricarboxylate transporter [Ceraceosorus bombacis]|uniref:Mitochondrial tricarboxylate transporter n=1 Tax=Ceraceosorus bombacis TaxID=401625 RepID=A0A0N7L9F6_9BASI|nr:mitochondrial tricarboxylate transporter [Ceraceosorus bombacis]
MSSATTTSTSPSSAKVPPAKKRQEKPLNSLVAGAFAGAVEGFATYPTEYVKTQAQFAVASGAKPPGPFAIVKETVGRNGVRGLYAGCSALVAGNAVKAGVRFLSYDSIKLAVADRETGQLTLPRSIAAGFLAGLCEGAFAVAPSEAIKTRLIEDGKKPKSERLYKGLISGSAAIVRAEGIRGIYKGLVPTMARQGANSAVRLTTYSTLRALATKDGRKTGSVETFLMGAAAGVVTVYLTMPFDVVKTRLQSANSARYTGMLNCFTTVLKEEGVLRFWKGTTPRLTRLILSGGIVFTIYENALNLLDALEHKAVDVAKDNGVVKA